MYSQYGIFNMLNLRLTRAEWFSRNDSLGKQNHCHIATFRSSLRILQASSELSETENILKLNLWLNDKHKHNLTAALTDAGLLLLCNIIIGHVDKKPE